FTFDTGDPLTTTDPNQINVNNWGNLIITNQASAAIRTDGIDLTARYELPTDTLGKFTLMANANLILNFEVQSDPSQPYQHYEGLWTANFGTARGLIPDYRLNFGLSWDFHGLTYSVLAHYIPPVVDEGTLHPQVASPGAANIYTVNGKAWYVPSYYTIDMQLAYSFGPKFGRFL